MVELNYMDHVAVVKLNRGVTNALNLALFQGLADKLRRAASDPEVSAVVLTSASEKFFSIGFDIPGLFQLPREEFAAIYRDFNLTWMELYTLPKPTVAVITGHAIAGGCILALCCDYRLMSSGRKSSGEVGERDTLIGLNEIKLGVPVPFLVDCILRDLVGTRTARDIVETGEFFTAEQALGMGLVDRVTPQDEVLPEAIERARMLGTLSQQAYRIMKQNRVESTAQRILGQWEDRQRMFVDRWYSDEARLRLNAAMEKFQPR